MYYPFFRGKQFELIAIREMASLMAENNFIPIIEPVRGSLNGLRKSLEEIKNQQGEVILIVNPQYGDFRESTKPLKYLINDFNYERLSAGILLIENDRIEEIKKLKKIYSYRNPVLIHNGFSDHRSLREQEVLCSTNIFVDNSENTLYRKNFSKSNRIIIRDGFNRQKNANYPSVEKFSELHITYRDLGAEGFGDFLTVGDVYSEGGGPAYAVAIHITFIDPDEDGAMFIYHFISDSNDTPTDPAGKFGQALKKLVRKLDSADSKILETDSMIEFKELYKRQHFPGLGYVKKLSMKHHIQTLAEFLRD